MKNLNSNSQFRKIFKSLWWMVLLVGIVKAGVLGCAASDPAGIPAPVSKLLVIGSPDVNDTVIITGKPQAVFGNAIVKAANIDLGGTLVFNKNFQQDGFWQWSSWLIPNAAAASIPLTESSVQANADGSFILEIRGNTDQTILIAQEVDGELSPSVELVVPSVDAPIASILLF